MECLDRLDDKKVRKQQRYRVSVPRWALMEESGEEPAGCQKRVHSLAVVCAQERKKVSHQNVIIAQTPQSVTRISIESGVFSRYSLMLWDDGGREPFDPIVAYMRQAVVADEPESNQNDGERRALARSQLRSIILGRETLTRFSSIDRRVMSFYAVPVTSAAIPMSSDLGRILNPTQHRRIPCRRLEADSRVARPCLSLDIRDKSNYFS